jgi:hypothetical protein
VRGVFISVYGMKLVSADGATVDLRPLRYQFPDATGGGQHDWDANWLAGGEAPMAPLQPSLESSDAYRPDAGPRR